MDRWWWLSVGTAFLIWGTAAYFFKRPSWWPTGTAWESHYTLMTGLIFCAISLVLIIFRSFDKKFLKKEKEEMAKKYAPPSDEEFLKIKVEMDELYQQWYGEPPAELPVEGWLKNEKNTEE